MKNIAVFASGTGTNFEAIQKAIEDHKLEASIECVVADHVDAKVVEKARKKNIEVFAFDPKSYPSKKDYEKEIVALLERKNVSLIVLAGYMRLCGEVLLNAYEGKIINIHPSLLPAFKGKDAIGQAIDYGVKVMGVTIHYVDSGMDSGKIIAQKSFDVEENMNREEIEASIHAIEHVLYPAVIQKLLEEMK